MSETNLEIETQLCCICGGAPMWRNALVDGAHPMCQALKPLEELLDATDDPSNEDETDRYSKTVHALLTLWGRLPRGEQEKTLRFLQHELADTNRMYAEVCFGCDQTKQGYAAMRENGLEIVADYVFGDGCDATRSLDVTCVSSRRRDDFFWGLTDLIKPFGGHVEEARYAGPNADIRVRCAICKRESSRGLMKPFKGGHVHFLCDAHERSAWRVGSQEEQR